MMQKQLIVVLMLITAMAKCSTSDDQNTDKDTLGAIPFPVVNAILPHAKPIVSIKWNITQDKIATSMADETVTIWTQDSNGSYEPAISEFKSKDIHGKFWDTDTFLTLGTYSQNCHCCSLDRRDGLCFVSSIPLSLGGYEQLWRARSYPYLKTIECFHDDLLHRGEKISLCAHTGDVLCTAWDYKYNGTKLATGAKNGDVIIWDFNNPALSEEQLMVLYSIYKLSSSYHSTEKSRAQVAQEIRDSLTIAFPPTDDTKMALIKTGLERQLDGIIDHESSGQYSS